MPWLQASVQRGSRQVRNRGLQRVEAIVERQQRVPSEGDDDRFLLDRQDRRFDVLRAGWEVAEGGTLLPFGDRPGVDAMVLGQHPQALLTMLYRSTDCRYCADAPVKNLSLSASFHCWLNNAPSKAGTKQFSPYSLDRSKFTALDHSKSPPTATPST
jgi:hypothetical protein